MALLVKKNKNDLTINGTNDEIYFFYFYSVKKRSMLSLNSYKNKLKLSNWGNVY